MIYQVLCILDSDHSDHVDDHTSTAPQVLVAKEHFVFTDTEGQLYHFSVEGNTIRDGTKIPAEASLGEKAFMLYY